MSAIGWEIVRFIDAGYIEGAWWMRYLDRLTPDERTRMVDDDPDFSDLDRPLRPRWQPGQLLTVTRGLEIRVGESRITRRSRYRIPIIQVIDNRTGGRVTSQRIREPLHEVSTICPVGEGPHFQPEPGKVPNSVVERLPATVQSRVRYEHEMTEARLALDSQPIDRRMRRILDAQANGANVSREVRAILGMLSKAEEKIGARRAA